MTMKLGIIPSVPRKAPITLFTRYGYSMLHVVSHRPGLATPPLHVHAPNDWKEQAEKLCI